jgi:ribosomal protein S18 acetylase RimI-like enzyme
MTSTPRIGLRRARPADLDKLMSLMAAFNRTERIPFHRTQVAEGLHRLLRERHLGVVVVAASPDRRRLDGYAIGTFGFDLEFAGPDAFLTELFVRPKVRQKGIGTRLLGAVMGALRASGARAVTLLVLPENTPARRLYARAGFDEIPRLAMVRRLSTVGSRKKSKRSPPPLRTDHSLRPLSPSPPRA